MMKKSLEQGVWAPHTPEKSVPPTTKPVSTDRKWRSHVGGSFSHAISQDSTDFNALTDCIDAAQSLKEAIGNSLLPAVSTPSENDNTRGSHKDYVDSKKQTQKKPKRKKYWPKVLVEVKPKKNPKPNKTPKPSTPKPCTPKPSKRATSKRCSDEKRKDVGEDCLPSASTKPSKHARVDGQETDATYVPESAKRALSFNLHNHETDSKKDARIIIHQYQRRKKDIDKTSCDAKALEQSKEGNLMVQSLSGMTSSFNPSEEWIQPTQLSETEREAANDPRNVNQSGCCNQNSVIVYQRVFRANQCLSSSRKLGPNFPRMWKKTRMTRRKATTYVIFKSLIAAEDIQMPWKKGTIRKQKATKFGYRQSAESAKQAEKWVKPSNFPSVMTKALEQSKEGNLMVQNLSGMTSSFNPSEEWIRPTQLSETEREAANDPHNVNQSGFCNQNSLIVYQRVFRANQCLSSSRKLGPNFPRMWKKTRMTRRKATTYVIFKSLISADDRQMPLKKGTIRKQKATNFGYRRSAESTKQAEKWVKPCNFPSVMTKRQLALAEKKGRKLALADKKKRQLALANKKRRQLALQKDEANCGGLVRHYAGLIISPTESPNRSTANDPSSLQSALFLTPQATPRKKRSYKPIPKLNLGSLALTLTVNRFPSAPLPQSLNVRVLNQDLLVTGYEIMVAKRQHMMGFLDNAVLGHNEVQGCPEHVLPSTESLQDLFSVQLTNGVDRLEGLHISDAGSQLVVQNQNAHGQVEQQKAVIVYKKRKPPPKVDIDQETMRVWKLLMTSSGEDVEEESDEDKEKWWEEQRNICRGRVDSFIARMHLVQGDRRFSRWKGSVVDSVVGVFLTQNVSDHLSSSAFMSLAAKYPLRSATERKACDEDGGIAYSQESVASNKRERIQDEILQQDVLDSLIDDPPSTSKHSIVESFRGFSEIVQTEYATCLCEFSTNENGDLLGNESLLDMSGEVENISEEVENAKQGSSLNPLNPLFGVNDTPSICSLTFQKHYACIPLTPSDVEVESRDSGNNTMNDVGDISDNLGCMESFGRDAVVQKKPTPRAQEATVELCASFSKCHVLPECLSQEEVNKAKGQELGKNYREESKISPQTKSPLRKKKSIVEEKQEKPIDWDDLRKNYVDCTESTSDTMDSLGWEEVRQATIDDVADAIKGRGQHRVLAERIKDFLDRVVRDHGSINLEWLRSVPPDKAKEYLLSFKGLGLKSVECVRLLTLQHHAFPVDTNVGRVAVRLGWVPLKPLPESLQIHLLEQYPVLDTIQIYLWPRLCTLDQRTLYELHYQMITFGKVFCRKRKPNCNACPMRGECRHFASAFASTRLALPGPQAATSIVPYEAVQDSSLVITPANKSFPAATFSESRYETKSCEPIIEHPPSPEPEPESIEYLERDIEDLFDDPEDYIPAIRLDVEEFKERIQEFIDMSNIPLEGVDMSKALVALTSEAASIPLPKLKDISWLRTIHHVYELPDSHRILAGFDKREPDDPSPYLLAIWTSGGTAISSNPPRKLCDSSQESHLSNGDTCSSCNNAQDQNVQTVCGTILIPCRTATRGSFPLNGTYFQVNEVFADDETSQHPLAVPRAWIWSLRRRTLHCGAYLGAIFGGLSTAEIQRCFWTGFVCVRAFNRTTRAPAHLSERFHISPILRGKKKFTEDE